MTSQGNTFKALSDINKRPNTRSRSRETQPYEDMPPFKAAKNIWEQFSKPPKGRIVIKENPVIHKHNSSSKNSSKETHQPNIMSVMVTNMDKSKDRMTELEKKINMLMKVVEEMDYEIASLKNHIESRDAANSSHIHTVKNTDKGKEMTANFVKTQYGGLAQTLAEKEKEALKSNVLEIMILEELMRLHEDALYLLCDMAWDASYLLCDLVWDALSLMCDLALEDALCVVKLMELAICIDIIPHSCNLTKKCGRRLS
ncbi:ty3-gypsy retrotransposon protein [Cucumis melo var. makuwa]|uniref:Ty3-gypsy retrotransposon protein n=1 Tax=Cucumis melo var. makuwa TaxID=1194695 RepID=A0A5A7TCW2_CUCMM|nr:ty3-gypsy retrotransposon protein [Cucumis melo var. makuwa]TYK26993.1 ty3-gypsy retrotransposon protein [Cucumis melo var. makuwa]